MISVILRDVARCFWGFLPVVVALVGVFSTTSSTNAATYSWNGGSSVTWSVASNWSPNSAAPTVGDIAQFASSAAYTSLPSLGAAATVDGLWQTGAATVTIGGTSALTLMGTNTINGNANTGLEMDPGAGAFTVNAPIVLGAAQKWLNSSSSALTISGPVSGNFGLTKAGTGLMIFGGSNTYTGATTVTGGTLQMADAYNGSLVHFAYDGNLNDVSGNGHTATGANSPTFATGKYGQAIQLNGSNQYVTMSNTAGLGLNAYTVSTWVNFSAQPASGGGPALFSTRNGGETTFDLQYDQSSPGVFKIHGDIGSGSAWINTSADATLSGSLSGWNMITYSVSSSGYAVYLNGVSIGSGGVGGTPAFMKAGETLSLGSQEGGGASYGSGGYINGLMDDSAVFGSVLSASQVASLYAGQVGQLPAATPAQISAATTLDLNGRNQTIASLSDVSGAGGTVTSSTSGLVTLTLNPSTATTFSGVIQNGGGVLALTVSGAGTQTLAGTSTYTGATTLSAGTLNVTGAIGSGSGSGTPVAVNGGLFNVSGVNGLTSSSSLTVATGGTAVISSPNNFSGAANLTGGILQLSNTAAIASSALTLSGGTLQLRSNVPATFSSASSAIASGTVTIDVNNVSSGTGNLLTLSGGTLTGAVNATSAINVTGGNGYSLSLGTIAANSSSGGPYAFTFNPTTAPVTIGLFETGSFGSTLTITGSNVTTVNGFSEGSNSSNGITVSSGTANLNFATSSYNARASGNYSVALTGGQMNVNNAGVFNNPSGSTTTFTISGGTLDNTSGAAITVAGNPTQSWSGSYTFNGSNPLNLGTGAVTLFTSPTLTVNGTGALTAGGGITGGFGLTKNGTGTLALTGSGNYTGGTIINGGTLNIGSSSLGSGNVTFAGGLLQYGSSTAQGFAGSIKNSTSAININTGGASVGASAIDATNVAGLAKSGAGVLLLSATSAYVGPTTISGGTLALASAANTSAGISLANASFETPAFASTGWSYGTTGASWTFTANAGVASKGSPWVAAGAVISGTNAAFIQSSTAALTTNSMAQSVTAPATGYYDVSFLAANRPGFIADNIAVQVDGITGASIPAALINTNGVFNLYSLLVPITSGTHTLSFVGTLSSGGDNATAIDNVNITGYTAGNLPTATAVNLSGAGAGLDLGGNTQSVASLTGVASANVLNQGAFTVGTDNSSTLYAGSLSGSGAFTKAGTGTLTLSGTSTYTGVTNINSGIVNVAGSEVPGSYGPLGGSSPLAANTISFGGGTLQYSASNQTDYSGRFSTSASQAVSVDTNGQKVAWYSPISSASGSLTKIGSGTLTLGASSTYTGNTAILGGTVKLAPAVSVITAASTTSFTTDAGSGIGTTSPYAGAYTEALSFNGTGGLSINGQPFTVGSQSGPGYLTNSWLNNYTTGTFSGAGPNTSTLLRNFIYGPGNTTQTLSLMGLTPGLAYDARVYYRNFDSVGGTRAATWTLNSGTASVTTGLVNQDANATGNYIDFTYVAGSAGTMALNAADFNNGNSWHLYGFTNQIIGAATNGNLPTSTALTIASGATLDLGGVNQQIGSLSNVAGAGGTVINSATSSLATLSIAPNATNTFSGSLQNGGGTLGLTINGSGTQVLTSANTYTGPTIVNSGTLALTGSASLTSPSITIASGAVFDVSALSSTFSVSSGNLLTLGRTTAAANDLLGSLSLNSGTINIGGTNTAATATFGSNLSLNGGAMVFDLSNSATSGNDLVNVAGNLNLSNTTTVFVNKLNPALTNGGYPLFTYSGSLTGTPSSEFTLAGNPLTTRQTASFTSSGSTVYLNVVGSAHTLTWSGSAGSLWNNNQSNFAWTNSNSASDYFVLADNVTFDDTNTNTAVNVSDIVNPGTMSVNGSQNYTLSGTGSIVGSTTTLAMNGTGILTIGTTGNTFGGGTMLNSGTIAQAAANAMPSTGTLTIAPGAVFDLGGFNGQAGPLTGAGSVTSSGTAGTNTLTTNTTNATTFSGAIQDGSSASVALRVSGTGSLTLAGANPYSGATTVNSGTLQIGVGGASGSIGGGAIADNGTVAVSRSDNVTYANNISGSGTLVQIGPGMLTLTGSNSYGATNISSGTLQVGSGGTAGSLGTGAVANTGLLISNLSSSATWSNTIGGSGSLTQSGSGMLTLLGLSSYTGTTTLGAGTLNLGSAEFTNLAGPLGNSPASNPGSIVLNGGILQYSAANQNDYSGRFSTAANQQYNVDTNGQSVTWATALTSSGGSLTKLDSGKLILAGANTYNGSTIINGGTLRITGSLAGGGPVTVGGASATGQPALAGTGSVAGPVTVYGFGAGAAGSVAPGLNTSGNFGGAGTLSLGGNLTFNSGAALDLDLGATSAVSDQISIGGTLALPNSALMVYLGDVKSSGGATAMTNGTYTIATAGSISNFNSASLAVGNSPLRGGTYTFSQSGGSLQLNIIGATGYASGVGSQVFMGSGNFDTAVGLNSNKTYINAVNLNGAAIAVNGVNFAGSINGNPSGTGNSNTSWAITGVPTNLPGYSTHITGNLGTLLSAGIYGGSPGKLTLSGLTPGQAYVLTFYQNSWDAAGGRVQTITTSDGATYTNDVDYGAPNSGYLDLSRYTFVATGANETLTMSPNTTGFTQHMYGFSTEQVFNNSWQSGTNWSTASWSVISPNYSGANALLPAQSAPTTLNLDVSETVGHLAFDGVNSWTLSSSNGSALTLQTDPGGTSVVSALTGTQNLAVPINLQNGVAQFGTGTLVLSAAVTSGTNTWTIANGTLELNDGAFTGASYSGAIADNSLLTVNNASSQSLFGVISGVGSLTKINSGLLTVSSSNTYTGGTIVSSGTLMYGAANVLSTAGALTVNGASAVLDLGGFSSSAGSLTVNNGLVQDGTLTAPKVFLNNGSVTATLAGSGIVVTKSTSGTVVLSGSNTYTGTTNIAAGLLQLGNQAGIPDNTALSLTGGTLDLDGYSKSFTQTASFGTAGTVTNSGSAASTISLTASGANMVIASRIQDGTNPVGFSVTSFGGASGYNFDFTNSGNTFSGGVTINNASARMLGTNANTAMGTGTITISNSGFLMLWANTGSFAGSVTVSNNFVLNTLGGPQVASTSPSQKTAIFADGNGGGAATTILAGSISLASNGGVDGYPANALYISGPISGTGALYKGLAAEGNGGNVVTLANTANSYSGGNVLYDGTLDILADSVLGSGGITFAGNSTLQAGANNITINPARSVTLASSPAGISGTIDTQGYTMTVAPPITGANTLQKVGSGTLILGNSANSWGSSVYGLTIAAGVVQLGPGANLSTANNFGMPMNMTGGTLDLNGATGTNAQIGFLGGSVGTILNSNSAAASTFTVGGNNASGGPFAGTLTNGGGVLALTKIGTGSFQLTGTGNAYTGATTVAGGTLALGSASTGQAAHYSFNGTANDSSGNNFAATLVNGPSYTTGVRGQNHAIGLNGTSQYVTVPYSASLNLTNAYTVSLWEQGTLASNGAASAGGPALLSTRNGGEDTFDLQINSAGLHADIGNGSGFMTSAANATVALGSGWNMITYDVTTSGYSIYINGVLNTSGAYGANTPELMKAGETLSIGSQEGGGASYGAGGYFNGSIAEVNVFNSALSASQIATLYNDVAGNNVLPASTPTIVASGATLDLVGVNQTIGSLSDAGSAGGSVVNSTVSQPATLTLNLPVGTSSFSGVIGGDTSVNAISLAVAGAGTQILAGTNTYYGATTINGGTLQLGTGLSGQDGLLANTSGMTDNSALVYNLNSAQAVSYSISGSGTVGKSGPGTLTLTAPSTYTGATVVNGGRLVIQNSLQTGQITTATGATTEVNVASGTYQPTQNLLINGAGTVLKSGSGQLTLGGPSSVVTIAMTGGTIDIEDATGQNTGSISDSNSNLVTSSNLASLNVGSGASLNIGSADWTVDALTGSGTVTHTNLNGTGATHTLTVGVNNGSGQFSGTIVEAASNSQFLSLVKQGTGTQTLTGANTFAGGTTLNAGGLVLGNAASSALGSGDLTINGGTLASGSLGSMSGNILAVNGVVAPGGLGSIGSLVIGGGIALNANSILDFDVQGGSADVLSIGGTLSESGTAMIDLVTSGTLLNSYTLATFTSGSVPAFSYTGAPAGYSLVATSNDLVLQHSVTGTATWDVAANGSWNDTSKWNTGSVPSGVGTAAIVGTGTTSNLSITLDTPQTLGSLTFTNTASYAAGYTLTPGSAGSLTLDNSGSAAQIVVNAGIHGITAPVYLVGGDLVVSASNNGMLTISSSISQDTTRNLTLNGDGTGTLILSGTNNLGGSGSTVTVASGTLVLNDTEALADGTSLTVGDASFFGGIQPAGGASAAGAGAAGSALSLAPVPEPGTLILLAAGAAMLLARRRRRV